MPRTSNAHACPSQRGAASSFVGSFRHTPNVDALAYFCRDVVPLLDPTLLEEHPVSVVGEGLSGAVCTPALGLEHVNLVGWVPDLEPYLARALMTVVPLRFGAGTKRKMIQALMVGTPTVATSVGTEGLDLEDGEHVLVADDAVSFARAIARLAEDEALWRRLSRRGSTRVGKDHSPAAVNDRFLAAVEETLERPAEARAPPAPLRARPTSAAPCTSSPSRRCLLSGSSAGR